MTSFKASHIGGRSSQKTTIDWCRVRVRAHPGRVLEGLSPLFGSRASSLRLEPLRRGILGFTNGAALVLDDVAVGRLDWGGVSQRGWARVDLSGQGCRWVQDWAALDASELPEAQLKRVDVALTTWDGEINHDQVLQAHSQGEFVTSGRPPDLRQITSSNPRAGRTCEIGSRAHSNKFMRCYEKGFEMVKGEVISEFFPGVTHIDGKPIEGIYRCEVEFKPVSSDIPFAVLQTPDQFFAGAYPFCSRVLPGIEPDILMRRPEREPQRDLALALEHIRFCYGATLFTALHAYGGDIGSVFERVIGDHHNKALVSAGVLMVDHV